jgi:SAM-dependent methyltransferase
MMPDAAYGADYYRGAARSSYADYAAQQQVVEGYWLPLVERYRRGLGGRDAGRFLDVGCAYGFLVDAYRRRGWSAEGCDVSEYAIGEGVRRRIEGLRAGLLPALDYPAGAFDLVTCIDVIEHLTGDVYAAYRAEFRRLLAPGGVLFVATPNALDCSGYNVFSDDWVEHDVTHINYRSVAELSQDFAGYERVLTHGVTPTRGMFTSYRPVPRMPRKLNGLARWAAWRLLGNDLHHSAYVLVIARQGG